MLSRSGRVHWCSIPIALLSLVACKSNTSDKEAHPKPPSDLQSQEQSPTLDEPRPPILPAPVGPISVTRSYQVGQPYTLRLERSGSGLNMTWLGTAEVLSTSSERTELGIHILSIKGEHAGEHAQEHEVNVRIKVTIEDDSHDAQIISSDSPLGEASDLTAFEMMAGDLCQPPSGAHEQTEEWKDGDRRYKYGGVTTRDGMHVLAYEETIVADKFESSCKASIALVDGYAGERHGSTTIVLGKDLPPSVQLHTLVVRRL